MVERITPTQFVADFDLYLQNIFCVSNQIKYRGLSEPLGFFSLFLSNRIQIPCWHFFPHVCACNIFAFNQFHALSNRLTIIMLDCWLLLDFKSITVEETFGHYTFSLFCSSVKVETPALLNFVGKFNLDYEGLIKKMQLLNSSYLCA